MTKLYKVTITSNAKTNEETEVYALASNAADAATIRDTAGDRMKVVKVEMVAEGVVDRRNA